MKGRIVHFFFQSQTQHRVSIGTKKLVPVDAMDTPDRLHRTQIGDNWRAMDTRVSSLSRTRIGDNRRDIVFYWDQNSHRWTRYRFYRTQIGDDGRDIYVYIYIFIFISFLSDPNWCRWTRYRVYRDPNWFRWTRYRVYRDLNWCRWTRSPPSDPNYDIVSIGINCDDGRDIVFIGRELRYRAHRHQLWRWTRYIVFIKTKTRTDRRDRFHRTRTNTISCLSTSIVTMDAIYRVYQDQNSYRSTWSFPSDPN